MLESVLFGEATPSENTQNIIQMIMEAPAFILATTVAGPIMEESSYSAAVYWGSSVDIQIFGSEQ